MDLPVLIIDGVKTLPLYCLLGKASGEIPAFGSGSVQVEYTDPDYEFEEYEACCNLHEIGRNADLAMSMVKKWQTHAGKFMYFVQFRSDSDRKRIKTLHDPTEALSIVCDNRLKIDPTPIWERFDGLFWFSNVQEDYRHDPEKEEKWEHYAKRLDDVYERFGGTSLIRFLNRMETQIELLRNKWPILDSLVQSPRAEGTLPLPLFYSYAHRDEQLRDQLRTHLSLLKWNGVIEEWHDRKIAAGEDWKGQIDSHLAQAKIILLLISADFLASEYCYDIEMNTAMKMHASGEARVIPVILRACDWHESRFGDLQAVPRDGIAVTSWSNIDEAFTDVAKKIKIAAREMATNVPSDRSKKENGGSAVS
jgi:hypothetical protein